jgi:hypothetical protein
VKGALILEQVLRACGAPTIVSTVLCTFLLWLGFVAVSLLHSVIYEPLSQLLRHQCRLSFGQHDRNGRGAVDFALMTGPSRMSEGYRWAGNRDAAR